MGESLVTRDQEVFASTDFEADIPQSFLSLLPSSSNPPPAINIKKEMKEPYVEACKSLYSTEELVTAIKYLNKLKGGIQAHRNSDKLLHALEHLKTMESRMDESGFLKEYSIAELRKILVESKWCPAVDFMEVVKDFLEVYGYPPSPTELVEFYDEQKVKLKKEVKEKDNALESSQKKSMSLEQTVQQLQKIILQKDQALQQKDQALQQKNEQHQQALQEKDQYYEQALQRERQDKQYCIKQKDRLVQQLSQRVRDLEENLGDAIKRRLRKLEEEIGALQEENRRLSAQAKRAMCKICWVEEVEVLLKPCHHLISCEGCVPKLPQNKCPACRETIQGTVKMYFA